MSKFSENALNKESRLVDYKSSKKELGKYFYDMSKATYVAMVIGGILGVVTGDEEKILYYILVAVAGLIVTFCFAKLGNMCHNFNKK